RRYGNRLLQLAEVHIEVFDLRAPAAAERALDASAGGPAGPHVIDACRRNGPDAGCVGGVSVLGLPVSHTSRSVQQEIGSGQKAKTRPRGPEPLELVISGQRGGRKCQDWKRRTAFLTGGLNVGFQPEYPCSKLIIVAGLDAANDAVDGMGHSLFQAARLKKDTRRRYPGAGVRGSSCCRGNVRAAAWPNRTSDGGFEMKKLFLATTAFVVLAASSAGAADMYARPAYGARARL